MIKQFAFDHTLILIYFTMKASRENRMNPFKSLWWSLMASLKGMTYREYLAHEKEKYIKQLAELPETDNVLTFLLEYYSFKNVKLSAEVLVAVVGISTLIYIVCQHYKLDLFVIVSGLWISQALIFTVGLYLRFKYKSQ